MRHFLAGLTVAVALALAGQAAAQSSPGFTNGQVPTAAQWNAAFAAKQDLNPGAISGPGVANPGDMVLWGTTYPGTVDGGPVPSVVGGSCITVSGAPAYTVKVSPQCLAPRGYIDGLLLSTSGSSQLFSVSQGVATDSTGVASMSLGSSLSKSSAATWTAGNGNGCLDTGSVAASTWYEVYLIERTDLSAVDLICSLSATSPAMPTNWTYFRRIGAMLTTSGTPNWTAFVQFGDEFRWSTPFNDVTTSTLGTTATSLTLHVPPGLTVMAHVRGSMASATPGTSVVVTSPLSATPVAGTPAGETTAVAQVASIASAFTLDALTDTSKHLTGVASAASTTLTMDTFGWTDRRGRNN